MKQFTSFLEILAVRLTCLMKYPLLSTSKLYWKIFWIGKQMNCLYEAFICEVHDAILTFLDSPFLRIRQLLTCPSSGLSSTNQWEAEMGGSLIQCMLLLRTVPLNFWLSAFFFLLAFYVPARTPVGPSSTMAWSSSGRLGPWNSSELSSALKTVFWAQVV